MTTDMHLPVDEEIAEVVRLLDIDSESAQARLLTAGDVRRTLFGLMRHAEAILAEFEEQDLQLRMIQDEVDRARHPKLRALHFLEEQIKALAEPLLAGKSKHVDIVGAGRVQFRDYQAGVRIEDPETFISALGADERERLVEMRPHLRTGDAKAYAATVLADHGEIIPGAAHVEAHREASIDYSGGVRL